MTELQKTTHQLEQKLGEILALVQDDNYALTFQSLGQYRTALIKFIKDVTK